MSTRLDREILSIVTQPINWLIVLVVLLISFGFLRFKQLEVFVEYLQNLKALASSTEWLERNMVRH